MSVTGKGGSPFRSSLLRYPSQLRLGTAWQDRSGNTNYKAIWTDFFFPSVAPNIKTPYYYLLLQRQT